MGNEQGLENRSQNGGAQPAWEAGLRILNTKSNSPAQDAGLQPFQDFVVGIQENIRGFSLTKDFSAYVMHKEDADCWVWVYNCFTGTTRVVNLRPRRTWLNADSLLGVKLRPELIQNAVGSVAKICAVAEDSPAHSAGIIPDRDYLVGCTQFDFKSIEEFSSKLQLVMGIEADPVLDLYIVNIGTLEGRLVRVKPNNLWKGANSLLGIEFGVGIFDTRLLRELLEKKGKSSRGSVDGLGQQTESRTPVQIPDHQVGYYVETKSVSGQSFVISTLDLFPALSFPLREYIYKA